MKKVQYKKLFKIANCVAALLTVAGCTGEQPRSTDSPPTAVSERLQTTTEVHKSVPPVVAQTTVLATVTALASGEDTSASRIVFSERGHGAAYIAKKDGVLRVIHNGKAGKPYPVISHLKVSPDGKQVAHDILVDGKRRMVLNGVAGKYFDDVWEPVFSPDSRHLAYIAQVGNARLVVVDEKISETFPGHAFPPVFNADATRFAYVESASVNRGARLVVSDLAMTRQSVHEIRDEDLVINKERTRIAVVRHKNNKQQVLDLSFTQPDVVNEGALFDSVDNIAYGSDGQSLAYLAKDGGKRYLVLNGRTEELPNGDSREAVVVRPDQKGAGVILLTGEHRYFLQQAFSGERTRQKVYDEAAQLVYNADGSSYAYCAKSGKKIFMVANGKEGPLFDMVISPMFTPDGKLLVYRARRDGKRFVVVADADGKIVRTYPGYEQVFDTVFTADGTSIAYGVKDGDKLIWKVEKLP